MGNCSSSLSIQTSNTYIPLNDQIPFILTKSIKTSSFPTTNIYAITSTFFRPITNRNNKLDRYLAGILDILDICDRINSNNYPNKLGFVLYVDESIYDKKSDEYSTISKYINNTLTQCRKNQTPFCITFVKYEQRILNNDKRYHQGLFPMIFRQILPMIDPNFEMAFCMDLDTASHYKEITSESLIRSYELNKDNHKDFLKKIIYKNDSTSIAYIYNIIRLLNNEKEFIKPVYNITGVYNTNYSWDIFNLIKQDTIKYTPCPTFYSETLYSDMSNFRIIYIELVKYLNDILTFIDNINDNLPLLKKLRDAINTKYNIKDLSTFTFPIEEIQKMTIEDIANYVKVCVFFRITEKKIGDITCGNHVQSYLNKSDYGFDEMIFMSYFVPAFIKFKLFEKVPSSYPRILSYYGGNKNSTYKYKGRLYKIRYGQRGGVYIIVNGKKYYI